MKDDIIPYAVKWFTGEAADSDEEDDDDEDEEDDEGDEVWLDSQHHCQELDYPDCWDRSTQCY